MRDGKWSRVFELQVRTMVEEVWGEIEHQLGYKTNQQTEFSVSRQFRVISAHLAVINEHFDFLYDRLAYVQSTMRVDGAALLNTENLLVVMAEFEISLAQDEVTSLLDIASVGGVRKVDDLRQRITGDRFEMMRRVFRPVVHDDVFGAFHVMSTVCVLPVDATLADVERQLRANLAMVELTQRTRSKRSHRP